MWRSTLPEMMTAFRAGLPNVSDQNVASLCAMMIALHDMPDSFLKKLEDGIDLILLQYGFSPLPSD